MRQEARSVCIGDPGRAQRLTRGPDLVAGRENADARPAMDADLANAGTGDERDSRRRHDRAAIENHGPAREVAPRPPDRGARRRRDVDEARRGQGASCVATARAHWLADRIERRRLLDRHDGIGPGRQRRAGGDPDSALRPHLDVRLAACPNLADDHQPHRPLIRRTAKIRGANRVAVHRRVVPRRQRRHRHHRFRDDAGDRGDGRDRFRAERPRHRGKDAIACLVDAHEARRR